MRVPEHLESRTSDMNAVPPPALGRPSSATPRATAHPYGQNIRSADRPGALAEIAQLLLGVTLSLLSGLAVLAMLGFVVALAVYLGR